MLLRLSVWLLTIDPLGRHWQPGPHHWRYICHLVCFSIKHTDDDGVHQSRLVLGLGCLILEKFVRIVTKHQNFCQDLICKIIPEEENKLKRGSQKRGGHYFLDVRMPTCFVAKSVSTKIRAWMKIWWYWSRWENKFDHEEDARTLLSTLSQIRWKSSLQCFVWDYCWYYHLLSDWMQMIIVNVIIAITMTMMMTTREDCLSNLGMADPPNPGRGNFYNVYIHHNEVIYLFANWLIYSN